MVKQQLQVFCYFLPINEAEEGGSTTVIKVTMLNPRPRFRRVQMLRGLKQVYGMTRAEASRTIREMEFTDITCTK